ncbi:hypothetical protein BH20VER1_BH20VER1_17370 [soil metagenome]
MRSALLTRFLAFLLLIFPGRFHHLIVGGFLEAAGDKTRAEDFFVVLKTGPGSAVAAFAGDLVAVAQTVDDVISIIGAGGLMAEELLAGLFPVGFGELVRIALVNGGDLTCAFFHQLWRGCSHPLAAD